MADSIHVVPAHLREAAAHHQETSDYLRTVPSSHAAIQESLDSLGPIFGELRDADATCSSSGGNATSSKPTTTPTWRRTNVSATMWEQHDEDAARELGGIVDGGR